MGALLGFGQHRPRRSVFVLMTAIVAVATFLGTASAAWANNDPHRQYLPSSPYDISSDVCGFTIHVDIPVDNQYGTFSTAPDGSTLLKVTGAFIQTFTNEDTGKSITLNSSGPGELTFPANTTLLEVNGEGLNTVYVTNGADFGVPNFFYS